VTLLVYDTGALIAADRERPRFWLMHERAMERGVEPIVPATVLVQVRRRPTQRGLTRMLRGCQVAVLDRRTAGLAGDLLGIADRSDIADAHVVVCCLMFGASCVTSDHGDIRYLAEAARSDRKGRFGRSRLPIIPV
jgi:hypothetical protein